jgi:hypothetical protein
MRTTLFLASLLVCQQLVWAQTPETAAPQTTTPQSAAPRVLEVDRKGMGPYKTLAAAAKAVQPGDTIQVKPNSGPYREFLAIRISGTADKPIVFDGGGNVITGFDPLTGWEEKDGVISCPIKFPCVLSYKGERLVQDFTTGQFTKYADLNETKDRLTLRAGVEKTDWEFSRRALAVSVKDVSYHTYRNVRASGSTNDGFNLHGVGSHLIFENVEGFHNLDEGFSSHDSMQIAIRGGKFWGNDNGIANGFANTDVLSNVLENVDVYDNLGFGLGLGKCLASLKNVRCWNNGVTQLRISDNVVTCDNVTAYTPAFATRIWASYMESKTANTSWPATPYVVLRATINGTPPIVSTASAPTQ